MNRRTTISTPRVEVGTLYFVALLREELGRRIAAARHSAGLSQRELANAIHLKNASDVSRYERGLVEVPSYRIDLIAEATGRPRSYFVRDPDEPETASVSQDVIVAVREEIRPLREHVAGLEALLRDLRDRLPEAPSATSGRSRRARSG